MTAGARLDSAGRRARDTSGRRRRTLADRPVGSPANPPVPGPHSEVIRADDVHFSYGTTPALRGVSLTLHAGESIALMGSSGSGKSTLLHCMAGILTPAPGEITLLGEPLSSLPEAARNRRRLESMGIVFQFGALVSELTLRENVMLPLELLGRSRTEARRDADEMLERLGIAEVAGRRTSEVSGGQAQRGAVARALVHRPPLLLADEPTGSLDSVSGDGVMQAFTEAAKDLGSALLVVTHDHRVAAYLDHHLTMRDGQLASADRERS